MLITWGMTGHIAPTLAISHSCNWAPLNCLPKKVGCWCKLLHTKQSIVTMFQSSESASVTQPGHLPVRGRYRFAQASGRRQFIKVYVQPWSGQSQLLEVQVILGHTYCWLTVHCLAVTVMQLCLICGVATVTTLGSSLWSVVLNCCYPQCWLWD